MLFSRPIIRYAKEATSLRLALWRTRSTVSCTLSLLNSYITNTSHPSCWLLLRRIMQLYYLGLVEGKFSEDGKYNILYGRQVLIFGW